MSLKSGPEQPTVLMQETNTTIEFPSLGRLPLFTLSVSRLAVKKRNQHLALQTNTAPYKSTATLKSRLVQYWSGLAIFSFLALISGSLHAQNTTEFALIESSTAETSMNTFQAGEKYEKAFGIYQQLVAAKGDYRFTAPPFVLSGDAKKIAFLQGDGLSIGLEEKAYDLLAPLGPGALAFILGHEVSHFYEKHPYQFGIYQSYDDYQLNQALADVKVAMSNPQAYQQLAQAVEASRRRLTKVTMETEADYLGGFLAYSAGYEVDIPKVFEVLYGASGYNLSDTIEGYITKTERIAMGQAAQVQMDEFIDIYEVANLLVALDRYADARVLYKYILERYQGREVYNNLGVLTTLEALELFSKEEKKYRLPLELDLAFNSATKDVEDKDELRRRLLDEAQGYFTSAISLDAAYAPAYLNLASVYYLKNDQERATFYAKTEAVQRAKANPERFPNTADNAEVLLALIALKNGEKAEGIKRLGALRERSALANVNWFIANDQPLPQATSAAADRKIRWTVDGLKSTDLSTATQRSRDAKTTTLFNESTIQVWTRDKAKVYRFQPALRTNRTRITFAISSRGNDTAPSSSFPLGSPGEKIIERYGQPQKRLTTVSGEVWVYDTALLIMGKEQELKRWAVME